MKSIIFSISRAIEFSNPIDYQNTMNFFNFLDSINIIIKYDSNYYTIRFSVISDKLCSKNNRKSNRLLVLDTPSLSINIIPSFY